MSPAARWKRIPPPALIAAGSPATRAWQRQVPDGHLTVLAGPEDHPSYSRPLWHLSISHRTSTHPPEPGRYPSWDEIADARYRFMPDRITVAMLLPPRDQYVNEMPTCFHLWELEGSR